MLVAYAPNVDAVCATMWQLSGFRLLPRRSCMEAAVGDSPDAFTGKPARLMYLLLLLLLLRLLLWCASMWAASLLHRTPARPSTTRATG